MRKKALLFYSMVVTLNLTALSAAAQKRLDFSNLTPAIKQSLSIKFPSIQEEALSLSQLDDVLRFLQLNPEFSQLRAVDQGELYRLEFARTLRISKVDFINNNTLSDSEVATHFGVRGGEVFDHQSLVEGGERLRQYYQSKGFLNAVVDIEMPPDKPDQVAVKVRITENKRTVIRDIQFQSPNPDLNKDLAREFKSYVQDPYLAESVSEIQDKLKTYLRKKRYLRAEAGVPEQNFSKDESEMTLIFRLEKVERYSLEFNGIRFLGIRDVEKSLDLDNFQSANPAVGTELAAKVKNYYLNRGYARVEVKSNDELGRNPFTRKISFDINEGPLIRIDSYEFTGSFSQPSKYYKEFIQDHSSGLIEDDIFNKEDLELGVKNLILELQNNGYLKAKLVSTRIQYNKNRDRVTVIINLDEGPLTVIQSIEFEGNENFTPEQLLKVSALSTGPLRLGRLENGVSKIKQFYQEHGFIEMNLLNERQDLVRYDESNTRAALQFRIQEGPQVRVGSIILEGNTFTRDFIILTELEFVPGDLLTPAKINESIARLQRTGYFGSVEISTLEAKTQVAQRTVLVKVTERDPGLFSMGLGATNERLLTLRGYIGIGYRNLYGTGRGISLRLEGNYNIADIKYLERRIVLGYLEPYLFETRVRGRVNLSRTQIVTDYTTRKVSEINSVTYSLEKDFTSNILGIWDVLSVSTIGDIRLDDRSTITEKTIDIGSTGPTVDLDFRDNPFNPTSGSFTRWNAEFASPDLLLQRPYYEVEYLRTTLSYTYYTSVGRYDKQPIVWANQVRGGYLKNFTDADKGGTPWDIKGFTLGGQTTVRGYESGTEEVFPNRQDLGISNTNQEYNLLTEATMYLIKSELRVPLAGDIGGALFYDGGSVKIKGLEFPESYRASAGFGVRYNTPVGPLSADLAWKLNARPGEEPWRFHLSIGSF